MEVWRVGLMEGEGRQEADASVSGRDASSADSRELRVGWCADVSGHGGVAGWIGGWSKGTADGRPTRLFVHETLRAWTP